MEECMNDDGTQMGFEPDWLQQRRDERGNLVMPITSRPIGEFDNRALLADVAFNRHSMNDGHHVSPSDNGKVQIGGDGIEVKLAQGIDEEAFKRTLSAAVRATIGLDVSQPLPGEWEHCQAMEDGLGAERPVEFSCSEHKAHRSTDTAFGMLWEGQVEMEDWEEMLKGGLQTALETQVIVFAVSGVSRTCTHQLVRTRKAAFHQQSQRASYMGDYPEFRMPESIWRNNRARTMWIRALMHCWKAYQAACEEDISYQDARFILPEGTTNFILLEYPVREFLNVYAYRGCSMFQWEIVEVMRKCRAALIEAHPWMEPHVKISCERTGPARIPIPGINGLGEVEHHCTFQGWESVDGQCDFPWALDEARTFKPKFHKIERAK